MLLMNDNALLGTFTFKSAVWKHVEAEHNGVRQNMETSVRIV